MIRRVLFACAILAGCRSQQAPAPGLEFAPSADSTTTAAPATFAELAPGDTGSVVAIMRRTMTDIDGALNAYEKRDTVLDAEPGAEPRRVTLWLEGTVPKKLQVTEPDEAGRMRRESMFWFVQGEVRVVQQPTDAYAFDADRILVWTDESLIPLPDVPTDLRMAREHDVIEQAKRWLGVFGVQLH